LGPGAVLLNRRRFDTFPFYLKPEIYLAILGIRERKQAGPRMHLARLKPHAFESR
jgi:hypothetical protein